MAYHSKKGGNSKAKKSGAGMSGRDMWSENRSEMKPAKPKGYGGTKNSTYIRPQAN